MELSCRASPVWHPSVRHSHMLKNTTQYSELLKSIRYDRLKLTTILELGVGTGILTQLILKHTPYNVKGIEIEPHALLKTEQVELMICDMKTVNYSFLNDSVYGIISNPPYCCLEFIRKLIDKYNVKNVILMVPDSKLVLFPEFDIMFILNHRDFDPPASIDSQHFVIKKGF